LPLPQVPSTLPTDPAHRLLHFKDLAKQLLTTGSWKIQSIECTTTTLLAITTSEPLFHLDAIAPLAAKVNSIIKKHCLHAALTAQIKLLPYSVIVKPCFAACEKK